MTPIDEDFLAKLRAAFKIEAAEHLQAITSGLLELESAADSARRQQIIATVFREAHSLKGAARAANANRIEMVCQGVEGVFSAWRRHGTEPSPDLLDPLHSAVNVISKLVASAEDAGTESSASEIAALVRKLDELQDASTGKGPEGQVAADRLSEPIPREATAPSTVIQSFDTVRISTAKLDALLLQTEETYSIKLMANQMLSNLRGMQDMLSNWDQQGVPIRSLEEKVSSLVSGADHDRRAIAVLVENLLENSKKLLMLPCSTLFEGFRKLVRDLSRDQGKEVELVIRGAEIEIDKRILEEMKDALVHLLRNSIDHGIERPDVRVQQQKPARGTITLAVSQTQADKVEILVSDDGRGLDTAGLRDAAVRHGILAEEQAGTLSEPDLIALAFRFEVSTSATVTEISGRGIGLSIVQEKVEKLGGRVAVESRPGAGTLFRLTLPLTLAVFRGVLVESAGQQFVLPALNIERVTRVSPGDIRTVENRETMLVDGRPLALVRLDQVLGLPPGVASDAQMHMPVVILASGGQRIGFIVMDVLREQEVLLKRLSKPLVRVRNVAAATVLGSGRAVIVLNAADLMKSAAHLAAGPVIASEKPEQQSAPRSVLVVEDSITARMLLKGILESAGYRVKTAVDGLDALAQAKRESFDLVISDVEMPRMNGFDLTRKIREDSKLSELPVILVTALMSDEDRTRGVEVGANAYIVKSSFDQSDLLHSVRQLI